MPTEHCSASGDRIDPPDKRAPINQAEMELAAIYDNAPLVMFIVNAERRVVKANRAALQLAGLSEEEAIGRLGGDLFHCRHASEECGKAKQCKECLIYQNVLESLDFGKSNQNIATTLTVATGHGLQLRHLKLSSSPVRFDGETMALVCIDDVTDLVEKTRQREESENQAQHLYQQFETLLDAIDDPICLLNKQFELLWTNNGYRELQTSLGCDDDGLAFRPYFSDQSDHPVHKTFASGKKAQADLVTLDGRSWQLRSFPLLAEGETQQVLAVAIDTSEKERLQEEALRTSRLASLGMLAAGVAHEINNPNAFILYNSDILQGIVKELFPYLQKKMTDAETVEFNNLSWGEVVNELPGILSAIQEGSQRIKRIVDDLRDYARHESDNNFSLVDLNDIAEAAVRLVHNPLKNSTEHFTLELAEKLPLVSGDFGRLEQVVINLLLNSCQALSGHNQAIRLKTFQPNPEQVVLQISDEGQGIPAEILESITKPFTTTKRDSGGTGLGLSVSNRIVKAHKGKLQFESEPGVKTTVSLILPIPGNKD